MKDRYQHQPCYKRVHSPRASSRQRTASRAAMTNSAYAQHVRPGLRQEEQEEPRAPRRQPTDELATPGPSGTEQGKERSQDVCAKDYGGTPSASIQQHQLQEQTEDTVCRTSDEEKTGRTQEMEKLQTDTGNHRVCDQLASKKSRKSTEQRRGRVEKGNSTLRKSRTAIPAL